MTSPRARAKQIIKQRVTLSIAVAIAISLSRAAVPYTLHNIPRDMFYLPTKSLPNINPDLQRRTICT